MKPGQCFGQWTLTGKIGNGGNGVVWEAENAEGKRAAIKFLQSRHFGGIREKRFRDEIEFLRRESWRHGILRLIDYNSSASPSEIDRLWFSSPLAIPWSNMQLSGVSKLSELVRHLEIIARILATLHDERIYHRDLKPENLFMLDGGPVIGDFGLVDFPGKEAVTTETEILGPLFYVAPEMMGQAADKKADKADVYSLAKTLWVLACGQRYPLPGEQRIDTLAFRISAYCPHDRAGNLDHLIQRATFFEPARRPSMCEFADELSAWLTPPSNEVMNLDLGALAKEYQSVFETESRVQLNRGELIDSARAALTSFDFVLTQIASQIRDNFPIKAQIGSIRDLELYQFRRLAGGPALIWRDAKGVRITIPIGEVWIVLFQAFVQTEALDDDTIRVVAGYLAEQTIEGRRIACAGPLWKDEAIAPRGSAQLGNKLKVLQTGLANNLNWAIRVFGDRVKDSRNQ